MALRTAAFLLTAVAFVPAAFADDPAPPTTPASPSTPAPPADPSTPPADPSTTPTPPTPTPPAPEPPKKKPTKQAKAEAKKHIAEGTKLYNVQQFAQAADEYQAAYVLDPIPEYLYAAAQSQRQGGDCTKALVSYNNYLRTNPKQKERDKAQKNIDRCEEEVRDKQAAAEHEAYQKAADEAAAKEAAKQAADAAAAKAAADAADAKRRADEAAAQRAAQEARAADAKAQDAHKSYLPGHIMLGLGLVAIGGGIYLFQDARGTISDYNKLQNYDEFLAGRDDADAAKTKQTIGIATIGGGVGLVAGAAVYYVLRSRSGTEAPPATTPTVSPSVGQGHAGLVVTGSF